MPTPAGPSPRPTEAITFAGPDGRTLQGAWAAADAPRGAVLVIHENRGLTDHIRSVAGRLAASGYSALAIDLLSEEGGTASFDDEAEVTAALNKVPDSRLVADMKAAIDELETRAPEAKIGAVGFCFGGGMVWTLLASGEPRLAAAAPFYGPLPDGADFAGSPNAAVLGVYAEQDDRVNATRDAAAQRVAASRPDARDRDLPERRPRLLQRHGPALQPDRRGGCVREAHRLVRQPPRLRPALATVNP